MSIQIDTKRDTITVDGITYDVERESITMGEQLTITLEGEEMFPGLVGKLENEEIIEEWMSPRDACNVGTMCVSYRGYNLGDEDISDINFDVTCPVCEGTGELAVFTVEGEEITDGDVWATMNGRERQRGGGLGGWAPTRLPDCDWCEGNGEISLSPIDYFKKENAARVVLPLIVYEHSGITMRCGHVGDIEGDSAGWDTSFVGFIYDTPDQVKECIGDKATDEDIEKALRQEVELYASYLEGDVRVYDVDDEESNTHDSCGGFLGDESGIEEECFCALGHAIQKRVAEDSERAYWLACGMVTV